MSACVTGVVFYKPKQQTTGQVFVIGVFFNNFRHRPGLNNFLCADVSFHSPTKGMAAEFKAPCRNIISYLLNIHQAYRLIYPYHIPAYNPSIFMMGFPRRPAITGLWRTSIQYPRGALALLPGAIKPPLHKLDLAITFAPARLMQQFPGMVQFRASYKNLFEDNANCSLISAISGRHADEIRSRISLRVMPERSIMNCASAKSTGS